MLFLSWSNLHVSHIVKQHTITADSQGANLALSLQLLRVQHNVGDGVTMGDRGYTRASKWVQLRKFSKPNLAADHFF